MIAQRYSGKQLRFAVLLGLAALLVTLACFGSSLAPLDPITVDHSATLQAPSAAHIFGTDKLGRDIFSRILCGAASSFFYTFLMVAIVSVVGTLVGVTAGYFGGAADTVIMRLTDVLLAFPSSVFAIAVAGILGAGIFHTVLALALVWWTKYARMTRSLVSSIKNQDFITEARFGGARGRQIIFKYILPNVLPQLVIMAALDVGGMMLALAGLSFLGLASQPPAPEWGYMLYESRQYMQIAPWMMVFPGLAILLTVIVFNLLGDSLRDMLDPKSSHLQLLNRETKEKRNEKDQKVRRRSGACADDGPDAACRMRQHGSDAFGKPIRFSRGRRKAPESGHVLGQHRFRPRQQLQRLGALPHRRG